MRKTRSLCPLLFLAALLPSPACGGGGGGHDAAGEDADIGEEAAEEEIPEEDGAVDPDVTGDGDVEEEEELPPTVCQTLGLSSRPFAVAEVLPGLGDIAPDFTAPTTAGDWNFRESWTGCDVYLIIQDEPEQIVNPPVPLWERDVDALLAISPRNVHYLFVSTAPAEDARLEALAALETRVEEALAGMSAEDAAWWGGRIHYVTAQPAEFPGWPAILLVDPGWGLGIDRFQRVRFIGYYGDPRRTGTGDFAPNLSMAAGEAIYYNFEAERQDRLDAEDAVVIPVFDGEVLSDPGWTGERGYAQVTLPEAADMAAFDTLELDLTLACQGEGEYGDCPAWDYIATLFLCDEADPDTCEVEMGRWITTYHREGRWVHDVSGLLPLIAGGGERRLAFYTQQPYEVRLDLRLSTQGREVRPVESVFLFAGGAFDGAYNDLFLPVTVPVPSEASRVELATVISGHGQVMPENCAEFCVTTHHFTVNGSENVLGLSNAGTIDGCMRMVGEAGNVPNQYGTWWYGRSGWCPGLEVPMAMTDVTDQVTPGADAVIEYQGFYDGAPYPRAGAGIVMSSWLVVSM
jgi:hypothetical protein